MKNEKNIKKFLINFLTNNFSKDSTILDIGAGWGSYADLLKDYFPNVDAVEKQSIDVKMFNLEKKYRKVFNMDFKELDFDFYNIIILGNVLEYFSIEESKKLFKYLFPKCDEILVAIPLFNIKNTYKTPWEGNFLQTDFSLAVIKERYPELKFLTKTNNFAYYIKNKQYTL